MASIQDITKHNRNSRRGLHGYICLMIVFKRIVSVQSWLAGCFVIFSLIVLSIFCWITVNCFGIVPFFMVAVFGAAFIGGLAIALFLIWSFGNLRNKSKQLIQSSVKPFRRGNNGDWTGYMKRKWAAQHPLPIFCGPNFAFSKDTLMIYMAGLSDAITSSLLLIKL